MSGKKNGLRLRITGPDGRTVEASSDAESVILGSGASAAVRIADPRVSNMHLLLKVDAGGNVTAIDLGSESGTLKGNQPLRMPTTLASGDVLHVGGSQVTVLFGDEDRGVPAGAFASGWLQGSVTQPPDAQPHLPTIPEVITPTPRTAAPPGLAVRRRPAEPAQPAPRAPLPARPRLRAARPAHLLEPLPPEAQPTPEARVLQVALLWGDQLLAVEHFADGRDVTLGDDKRADFTVHGPELGARFTLARGAKDGLTVSLPAGARLIVTEHGTVKSRDALRAAGRLTAHGKGEQLKLTLHERAEVALGTLTFVLRNVRPSEHISVRRVDEQDLTFFKISAVAVLMFLGLVAAVALTERSDELSADDIARNNERVAKFLITPPKKEAPKKQLSGVEEGAKAKDEEGKFGKEEAKKPEADPSKPGAPVVRKDKKEADRQKVSNVGLLGAMKGLGKGAASDVLGPGGLGSGINNSLGGLKGGAGMGDAQGVGGMGSRGTGTGGGGTALGLGGLGTKGTGRGTGGTGGIDLGGRGKEITKIVPGKTTVVGGLDKDVIQKIIRRHESEIKYCYETELNKKPGLQGKVAVAFTIDPTGGVSDANVTESTLGSSAAEQCMLARIRRWKFPEPKGGGVVAVTYPWLFAPAGSDT